MASLVDACIFVATSTGTGSFVVASAKPGWRTPAEASAVDGATYRYRAFSDDQSQWEVGTGVYTVGTTTLTRAVILGSSNANAAVNFSAAPNVALTVFSADFATPAQLAKVDHLTVTEAVDLDILREPLTANRTYYVRTDGNDSNNGLANTSGGAFLTIQKAIDFCSSALDFGGYTVTVQVADGTYTGAVTMKAMVGMATASSFVIQGNTGTPSNVLIHTTSATAISANGASILGTISYLKVQTTTAGLGVTALNGASIRAVSVDFGAVANYQYAATGGGSLFITGNYTISGNATFHMYASTGSLIVAESVGTITLTGTPAFSFFVYAETNSSVRINGNTYSGSATGTRYSSNSNATIFTNGAGPTYLPGSLAGTTASGGAYDGLIGGASALTVVRVVDTTGAAVATDYENGDTIDGVVLATDDLILRATSGGDAADGVYVVPASGAASRDSSFDTYNEHPGAYFSVMEGTANADTLWRCTSNKGGTIDSTALEFSQFSSGSGSPTPPQGRLTLQTAVPVMTSTQSAKTTIYYTPYAGAYVPIYNGSAFTPTKFSELSVATTDTNKSPAAIGANNVNDWFVWDDSGTLRLSHGPDWTNDTTRSAGTALVMVDGILLNNASITNGPAASRGTYVGTTRSNSSSQLDYIFGASASGGTAAFFGVWNAYNRVAVTTNVTDSGAGYTYTTATIRQARASAGNQITFVRGLAEDGVNFTYTTTFSPATVLAAAVQAGIGLDSTAGFSGPRILMLVSSDQSASRFTGACAIAWNPGIGVHYAAALEQGDGTNINTFDYSSDGTLTGAMML